MGRTAALFEQQKTAYLKTVKKNAALLTRYLETGKYPYLQKLLTGYNNAILTKYKALLLYLFEYETEDRALELKGQNYIFYAAQQELIERFGGTWDRALKHLCLTGFIHLSRPRTTDSSFKYNSEQQKKSVARAKASEDTKRKPVNYYSIEPITKKLMQFAEERAKVALTMRGSISKDSVRDMTGKATADKIFDNGYNIFDKTEEQRTVIFNTVEAQIKEQGYTTKENVLTVCMTKNLCSRFRWEKTFAEYKPLLFTTLSIRESRPTAAEKERFNLNSDNWIIR